MLKEILKAKGLKQTFVAQRIGVSAVTVNKWVQEKSFPSKKHIDKLCQLLDVTSNELVH